MTPARLIGSFAALVSFASLAMPAALAQHADSLVVGLDDCIYTRHRDPKAATPQHKGAATP